MEAKHDKVIETTPLYMMNNANESLDRIKVGLGLALLAAMTGCVGYVGGGYYGSTVLVPGPNVYFWGGDYDRGRDVHVYSQRGVESRAVAHPSGGRQESRPAPGRPPTYSSQHTGSGAHVGRQ